MGHELPVWLRKFGQWVYNPIDPVVALLPACAVQLIPMQTIVLARLESERPRGRTKLVTIDMYRPHPARRMTMYCIEEGAELIACRPARQKKIVTTVFVAARNDDGACQLRFDMQSSGKVWASVQGLEQQYT
jgi:hypothetical protein